MLHKMKLQDGPFRKMQKGRKTIELRLNDEKRQRVTVGDQIEFTNLENRTQKLLTRVIALHRFDSFEEMFRTLPAEETGTFMRHNFVILTFILFHSPLLFLSFLNSSLIFF